MCLTYLHALLTLLLTKLGLGGAVKVIGEAGDARVVCQDAAGKLFNDGHLGRFLAQRLVQILVVHVISDPNELLALRSNKGGGEGAFDPAVLRC